MQKNLMHNDVTAIVLAGGQARRMGGVDKGLVTLNNRPLIEYVLDSLKSQTRHIIINANRNHERYKKYGYPIVEDDIQDYSGPLSGISSCMKITRTRYLVSVPCDSPFIPGDLISRLYQSIINEQSEISVVHDGERMQPVFALMKVSLLPSLLDYLSSGERKIDRWYSFHRLSECDFSDNPGAFININTQDEISNLEAKTNG